MRPRSGTTGPQRRRENGGPKRDPACRRERFAEFRRSVPASGSRSAASISAGRPAQIAMMHRMLVDEKKWIDEPRFLHALNFCMLLPGPEAQKLATYIGWALHGVRGGLVAGILFVLPGALFMLGLSLPTRSGAASPWIDGALFGIKAAVLVIVVEALLRIGKRALKTPLLYRARGRGVRRHLLSQRAVPADRRGCGADRLSGGALGAGAGGPEGRGDRHRARRAGPLAAVLPRGGHRPDRVVGAGRARGARARARAMCWSASARSSPSSRW